MSICGPTDLRAMTLDAFGLTGGRSLKVALEKGTMGTDGGKTRRGTVMMHLGGTLMKGGFRVELLSGACERGTQVPAMRRMAMGEKAG